MNGGTGSRGTMECPICGFDKPHTHDHATVEWHRTGRKPEFQETPINVNQRRTLRIEAEGQYRRQQEREAFDRDPRAFLYSLTVCEKGYWVEDLLLKLTAAEQARDALRALVEKWRETAKLWRVDEPTAAARTIAGSLEQCADDLTREATVNEIYAAHPRTPEERAAAERIKP